VNDILVHCWDPELTDPEREGGEKAEHSTEGAPVTVHPVSGRSKNNVAAPASVPGDDTVNTISPEAVDALSTLWLGVQLKAEPSTTAVKGTLEARDQPGPALTGENDDAFRPLVVLVLGLVLESPEFGDQMTASIVASSSCSIACHGRNAPPAVGRMTRIAAPDPSDPDALFSTNPAGAGASVKRAATASISWGDATVGNTAAAKEPVPCAALLSWVSIKSTMFKVTLPLSTPTRDQSPDRGPEYSVTSVGAVPPAALPPMESPSRK